MRRITEALNKLREKCTSHGAPKGNTTADILECIAEHYEGGGGSAKLYRHNVTVFQDSYFDAVFQIMLYSASNAELTAETIVDALETGMIGVFTTPMFALVPTSVDKFGSTVTLHYWDGTEYGTRTADFSNGVTDVVTEV